MKYLSIVAVGVAAISCFFFVKKSDVKKDSGIIVVGTSADYQPYAFIDPKTNEIVGFDVDVVREVVNRLGCKIEIKDIPFASLIFGILSGQVDVVAAGMSPTPKRAETVAFSAPYIEPDPFVIISQSEQMSDVDALVGKKVAVNAGYTAEAYLSNKEGIELVRLKSPAESMMALKSGAVDAFVCARSVAKTILNKNNDADHFYSALIPDTGDGCALVVNKNNSELVEKINVALEAMAQDGALDALKEKWNLK